MLPRPGPWLPFSTHLVPCLPPSLLPGESSVLLSPRFGDCSGDLARVNPMTAIHVKRIRRCRRYILCGYTEDPPLPSGSTGP
jgi:hypothetical protein